MHWATELIGLTCCQFGGQHISFGKYAVLAVNSFFPTVFLKRTTQVVRIHLLTRNDLMYGRKRLDKCDKMNKW